MLDSQVHPKFPSLVGQIAIPRSLILLIIFYFINGASAAAQWQLQNITVPVTSTQITYTPFVCNASTALTDPQPCAGAWQLSNYDEVISTNGPSGSIVPQLFFDFQASILYLTTVSSSNASVNLTLSAGGENISTVFNSSLGLVSIVDLPPNETTHLTVTYIPGTGPTLFSLESIIITVPNNSPTDSIFPTPTQPPSASLPTVISTPSSASVGTGITVATASNKTKVARAVGITIGITFGLTAIAIATLYHWKRRKRRLGMTRLEDAKSEWISDPPKPRFSHFSNRLSRFSARMSKP